MKDLSNLKVGDKVWVTGNRGIQSRIEVIKRFTKTLIVTEVVYAHGNVEHKYDRESGSLKGTDRWTAISIEPFTEKHQAILNKRVLKANINTVLVHLDNLNKSDKLTSCTLEKLNSILEEVTDED